MPDERAVLGDHIDRNPAHPAGVIHCPQMRKHYLSPGSANAYASKKVTRCELGVASIVARLFPGRDKRRDE